MDGWSLTRIKEWLYFKSDGTPLQPANDRLVDASCGSGSPYVLKLGEKFGLVDAEGKSIALATFDALIVASRSAAWNAEVGGKWGRIGPDGRWLLEPKFDYLSRSGPIIVASTDGKRGFLRSDGSWIIEPRFDAAGLRDSDSAFVTIDGMTGILKLKDQSWVVPPRPGVMCDISYGILWQSEKRRAILSRQGESWVDIEAERMGSNLENGLLTFLKDGKWDSLTPQAR
jgi:WG containing repeat